MGMLATIVAKQTSSKCRDLLKRLKYKFKRFKSQIRIFARPSHFLRNVKIKAIWKSATVHLSAHQMNPTNITALKIDVTMICSGTKLKGVYVA